MREDIFNSKAARFFDKVTNYPKTIIALSFILIVLCGFFLKDLTKDPRAEAFIRKDHPSILYRDKVKEIFGLSDPVVIAIVNEGENGVFNPQTLSLVSSLTEKISNVENVDPDRITSIATENDIYGTDDGMIVDPFFEYPPETLEQSLKVKENIMDFPLYVGSLVSKEGNATLIAAELLDKDKGLEVYESVLSIVEKLPKGDEKIFVAGEGAISGYLGSYIDSDATRLNPIAGLIITIILFITYRTFRGVLLPNLVVLGSITVGLGLMSAANVPFYVITNALPVILIAIGVADGIHILGQYYEEVAKTPEASPKDITVRTMTEMWRPVTVTSFTDIAGFLAISFSSFMPPMKAFGVFASFGILAALLFSLFTIPAILVLLKPKQSSKISQAGGSDKFGKAMSGLGAAVSKNSIPTLVIASIILVVGILGALRLQVNEERIRNFKSSEKIYIADRAINKYLDGTTTLDIVVETDDTEGLFNPDYLKKIEALQEYIETLPNVSNTTSIVDYLKQMNRAMNEDNKEFFKLPDKSDLIAQYFLIYSASGDPTDFEEEIDYDYRLANVRATMNSGLFTDIKKVIIPAQKYVDEKFNEPGLTANLAGRANVDFHWISGIKETHFRGVGLALLAVVIFTSLVFRSLVAGLLIVVPVSMAVLFIYAVMGYTGIWLGVGTSMFAAIAIGTGVDFAVHTLDRLITLIRDEKRGIDEAFTMLFPSTGRALLFNFSALFLGFGVLVTSHVPPLIRFGSLVGVAALVSFLASQTVIPALIKVIKPKFLTGENN